ncbi:hypothetical protein AVEN_76639-1, partial [Araneus ventricosus]
MAHAPSGVCSSFPSSSSTPSPILPKAESEGSSSDKTAAFHGLLFSQHRISSLQYVRDRYLSGFQSIYHGFGTCHPQWIPV